MNFAIYRKNEYACPECASQEGALYPLDIHGYSKSQVFDVLSILTTSSECLGLEFERVTLATQKDGEVWKDAVAVPNLPEH